MDKILGEDVKNTTTIINATAVIVVFIFAGISCKPAANTNTSPANANSNAALQPANVNAAPVAETNSAPASAPGSLATPSDAYRTAYELRKRKDVQGLKKIMSPDILEFLTMMGEDEKKSLDEMIKDMCDKPQADKAEVRNEVIKGDLASVEYLTETGGWKSMDFEKIGGEWKLTFPKADSPDPGAKKSK
jgi:hypothetical protein